MSKKKSVTTMTLKDFHGGSIPSDLPLPSAPGVSARPSQDRNTSMPSRSERTRHVSASPASISPLPAPPRMIGRHFDEDERTPFDAPPQWAPPSVPVATGAWANRKDQSNVTTFLNPVGSAPGPTVWSPSRIAQASAVEKVISGRWLSNSKTDAPAPPVSDPIGSGSNMKLSEPIGSGSEEINPLIRAHGSGFERPVARSGVIGENRVKSPVIQAEIKQVGSGLEEFHPFGSDKRQGYFNNWDERPRSVGSRSAVDFEGRVIGRPVSHEGRFGAGEKEGIERPKLKLLPRSKPIENPEIREDKMRYEMHKNSDVPAGCNYSNEMNGNEAENGSHGNERPRLNLKPRSHPVGALSDESAGNKRQSVFGGARPRELVLKERGVDHITEEPDKILPSNSRPDSGTAKTELKLDLTQKHTRNPDPNPNSNQKDFHHYKPHHQPDTQRINRRAPHQHQTPRPEPDTWRKPEPPAKQETSTVLRVGKGATALELAQAFSKRVLDAGNENPVRRNENPVVFSRLLGGEREVYNNRAPHQQINGY